MSTLVAAVPALGVFAIAGVALDRFIALGNLPQPYTDAHPGSLVSSILLSALGWSTVLTVPAGILLLGLLGLLGWQRRLRVAFAVAALYVVGLSAFFFTAHNIPSAFSAWLLD